MEYFAMFCKIYASNGFPCIGNIGLGVSLVKEASRVPNPAHKTTAFKLTVVLIVVLLPNPYK